MTTILLADDRAENLYLLETLLNASGYKVICASNGSQALELALQAPPDLIIADILMPVMDGFDLCRRWRTDDRLKEVPFIFYTATYTDTKDEQFALGLGADRFVIKPQTPQRLLEIVREVLGRGMNSSHPPRQSLLDKETVVLQEHKDALFRKLERKVTQLQAEEEKLRLTNLVLRTQMEASIDGIAVVDESGKVSQMNRRFAEMWGIPADGPSDGVELLRRWILPQLAVTEGVKETLAFALRTKSEISRAQIELKDGRTFDRYSTPMVGDRGEFFGRLWSFRDVTEQKQAEEARLKLEKQLRVSQKMEAIGMLAGGVAHDFNNLLSVILTYTDFAVSSVEGQLKTDLLEVKKAAEKGAALTRQLLAFSRKQVLQPEPLDLSQVARGLEKMLRRIIGEDIVLAMDLPSDLGFAMADPGQIEQVIMNLVVNARDAMPEGGKLCVETANVDLDETYTSTHTAMKAGPHIMLSVTDTGCGMDKQTLARIFEPFFSTKDKTKGTGLGLSTVYGIVVQSGGSIDVCSEPGKGSRFKVFLPRIFDTAPVSQKSRVPVAKHSSGNETILLVDDEPALRSVGERVLRLAGYQVLTAASGDEALEISRKYPEKIHLLVTDVVMPQMSGRLLAEQLSKSRPDLRILYLSGYADSKVLRDGVLEPNAYFVSKPFSVANLTRQVRRILNNEPPNGNGGPETHGH